MKNALAITAVAGLASVAAAGTGNTASLSIVPSVSSIDSTVATSFTLGIYGDANFGNAISGGEVALSSTSGGSIVTDMSATTPAWGALGFQENGYTSNGNYDGFVFGQLIFPPFIPAAAASLLGNGPVLLGTVTVSIEANSAGTLSWNTVAGTAGDFMLEVFVDDGGSGSFTQFTEAELGQASVSVNVVPAPSAMALLGLGGLVAGRRRR